MDNRPATLKRLGITTLLLAFGLIACDGRRVPETTDSEGVSLPPGKIEIAMDFRAQRGFYAAPFPSEHRRLPDGRIDISDFPNPGQIGFVDKTLATIAADARGFGLSSAIYFRLSGAIDTQRLPTPGSTLSPSAMVFLLNVDAKSADHLVRAPLHVDFQPDAGPFGDTNLLGLLPIQGAPLRPLTLYAAVVLRGLVDVDGVPLRQPQALRQLIGKERPEGMPDAAFQDYREALVQLDASGVSLSLIAGIAVFRTDDPSRGLARVADTLRAGPVPKPDAPFALAGVYDGYCAYTSTIAMPVFQGGTPPYSSEGGGWVFDAAGAPQLQRYESANIVVTVPRQRMPSAGFAAAILIKTGLGGDQPLIDRGVHGTDGSTAQPGHGPGYEFARVGVLGVSVDGPHVGRRNITKQDEQFLIFNILNPVAMRDNVRQSAAELILVAKIVEAMRLDASDCPGLDADDKRTVRVDASKLVLFGHSMGATIAPLAVAHSGRFRGLILSGAGGSWLENLLYKQKPLPVKPLAEGLIGYGPLKRSLHRLDPVLTIVQWAGEPSDPQVYARHVLRERLLGSAPHVLMLQGVVDHYIMPPIANALSLPLGLDLAGERLDGQTPELSPFTPLDEWLALFGRTPLTLPASGNLLLNAQQVTAIITQHREDGVEDGHEVAFQREGPKRQYRCFLSGIAAGRLPVVPHPSGPCD